MTSELKPRHTEALRRAYETAKRTGHDLQARYLREALNVLGVELYEKKQPTRARTPRPANMDFMRAMRPSNELAEVIGFRPAARAEVVSKLWHYIKKHKLQDNVEKRMVNCDEKLKAIFGKDKVSMFEMAGILSNHLS